MAATPSCANARAAGRKEAEIVREAIAQYLGLTDPNSVKGTLEDLQERVANVERAQMLLECDSRPALQQFLTAWQSVLAEVRRSPAFKPLIRWAIDVDPLAI